MIVFPALAAAMALACAAFTGVDAVRRPRPERALWTLAFLVFAIAAASEVLGQTLGWSVTLARVYYLAGAVLVVGILALGELYLLFSARMPVVTPGIALLVVAVAITVVWSAPVNGTLLPQAGWHAIERGPLLIALAVAINAGGTVVLVAGALVSAWRARVSGGPARRATGCFLIAIGTLVVATGGTLTRFGRPEYLYLAMAVGIAVIFAGIVLTRSPASRGSLVTGEMRAARAPVGTTPRRMRLVPLERRESPAATAATGNEGARFVAGMLLEREPEAIAELCRWWSATPVTGDALTRDEAHRVWGLRLALRAPARDRFDRLPVAIQTQLAELYAEVWSLDAVDLGGHAAPASLSILPSRTGAEAREHEHV